MTLHVTFLVGSLIDRLYTTLVFATFHVNTLIDSLRATFFNIPCTYFNWQIHYISAGNIPCFDWHNMNAACNIPCTHFVWQHVHNTSACITPCTHFDWQLLYKRLQSSVWMSASIKKSMCTLRFAWKHVHNISACNIPCTQFDWQLVHNKNDCNMSWHFALL